ncbi:MAG: bifunctional diguanylate cyclase/phosphodiesterase [Gammaproteobacteria bacterium]|nr:bifunctional diguanylate cyclase/phosphodiesterase [Gammaproteobacteria bacterium]
MLGVLLIHLLSLPFLYVTIIGIYKNNAEEQFIGHVRELTGLLSDFIPANEAVDSANETVFLMESAMLGGEVIYIELVNENGDRLFPDEDVAMNTVEFIEDRYIGQHDDEIYFISLPVYLLIDDVKYTRLRIGFNEAVVLDRLALVKKRSMAILGIYFVCIILLLSYLTSVIMRPLKQLGLLSKKVAAGERSKKMKVSTRISEVSDLSEDLECMRLALVEQTERMHFKAMHDELTGLPNRSLNNDRIDQAISRASRKKSSFAVLLLDLDRFKEINDTLGHGVGDEILKVVAERLKCGIRESDTIARIGGDEFCAILEGVERVVAEKLAMKLAALLEPSFRVNGHTLQVGASIGIAVYPENGEMPEILFQHADVAMYEAKYQGLKVISYHEDMDKHRIEDLQLTSDIREGLKSGQFYAAFQPKVDLSTGKPYGCEMLARWEHPRLGLISPDKFIPIMERENLIGEMTQKVFDKHLPQLKQVIDSHPGFKVSINVSPLSLLDTALLDNLEISMQLNGVKSSSLIIEVTENAIMTNPLRSARILQKFADAGIGVSVDDFGTGYSSLSYLQKFPINELKVDKSFIIGLNKNSQNYPIVNATITMSHDLGMSVIAEGVEEMEVIDLLVEMKCYHVQGRFFSQPLSFTEFKQWIEHFEISEYW